MNSTSPPPFTRLRLWLGRFRAQRRRTRIWQGLLLLAVLAGLAIALGTSWGSRSKSPLLETPSAALEAIKAKSLYYNGLAWPWLKELRPDLLRQDERTEGSERVRLLAQAVQNPKLFRQLDRQDRFDELLLVGAPSQYRPLLDHLLETRDWVLTYVDHTSYLFQRGAATKWEPGQLAPLRARWEKAGRREQATFLAQTAGKLIALREYPAARELLESAEFLGAKVADVPSVRAQYHLMRGEWKDALAAADKALKLDDSDLSALGTKVQALYSTKQFNEAYTLSQRLIEKLPDDPAMLFYHAKIALEARAFQDESRVLRHLIALAQANERSVAGYRVYLGQSLASAGKGTEAVEEFALAMSDPDLPKEQRDFAQDCVDLIRSQGK